MRSIRQDARKEIVARGRGPERAVHEATDAAVDEVERLMMAKAAEVDAQTNSLRRENQWDKRLRTSEDLPDFSLALGRKREDEGVQARSYGESES